VACVGLYGGLEPPKRWHPLGAQHRILHGRTSVVDVTVEEAVGAVLDVLAEGDGRPRETAPDVLTVSD
jgi:hypothetical protein